MITAHADGARRRLATDHAEQDSLAVSDDPDQAIVSTHSGKCDGV